MTDKNQPLSGNAMPRFGGLASMMRLPVAEAPQGLDAAFIGVPLDIGTSHRPGARFGPRQIRAESALIRPYNMATGAAPFDTLQGFNHNLVRASLSLGASPVETFFRVTLPVIAPGVISGALFAFATSFDEVVVTLFIAGPSQVTLPRQMFTGIRENINPTIAAVATLLTIFTTSLMLVLEWIRGKRR